MAPETGSAAGGACPVCGSAIGRWRVKRAAGADWPLDLCGSCGFAFVNPRPSLETLMRFYAAEGHGKTGAAPPDLEAVLAREREEPNSTLDARRMVAALRALARPGAPAAFLDVGCGYGFFAREAREAGFAVTALELAENERAIALRVAGIAPAACPFETFEHPAGVFGAVCMSQVLEHALDVNAWVAKARTLLAEGGLLAVAVPNFGSLQRRLLQEREPYVCPPAHLNYFNPASLGRLLARHGFRVEAVQWVSRLPRRTIAKRLPGFARPLAPLAGALAGAALRAVDALRLGAMISVYARKEGP